MEGYQRENKKFLAALAVFMGVLFVRFFDFKVIKINATMLAFSYKYGFISRGLIGSIYSAANALIPWDIMNYAWMYRYTLVVTMLFYVVLFAFYRTCLKRVPQGNQDGAKYLIVIYTIYSVPMFASQYNFGRLDLYCILLTVLAVLLLIAKRAEWLVIPLAALAVMVHQGYVFMFAGILLILLLYRAVRTEGKERRKYIAIFALTFLGVSALFLWFELFSHYNGENIYEDICRRAASLCLDGDYHEDVIDHEILGVDLTSREVVWHWHNVIQFPFYLLLTAPYICIGLRFFFGILKKCEKKEEKLLYTLILIGAGTILPDMLLKVDYGRWMYAITSYYCVVLLALLAMGDELVNRQMTETMERLVRYQPLLYMLVVYTILLQPLCDVNICPITNSIGDWLNTNLLHIYVDPV